MKSVAVIGGGASGMMAAVSAAENGAKVSVFERNDRIGKKILMTGNGKCNFSNRKLGMEHYNGMYKERLPEIFSQFTVEDTTAFFHRAGMLTRERNGYLYPFSEQASTVLDILRLELNRRQVDIRLTSYIDRVEKDKCNGNFLLWTDGKKESFDSVIIACGGAAAPKTGSDGNGYLLAKSLGHPLVECVPALVQLRCRDTFCKALAGVRCEARLRLMDKNRILQEERGELQFTEYGISGIPVFQFSRRAAYMLKSRQEIPVYLDLLPDYDDAGYRKFCQQRIRNRDGKNMEEFLLGMANKKVNMVLLKQAGFRPQEMAIKEEERKLQALLASYRVLCVHVTGTNSFEHAQVTAGGVDMRGVAATMESTSVQGLYFAGEILDVDGRCGGYNLQWAWTSGHIAGRNAAQQGEER